MDGASILIVDESAVVLETLRTLLQTRHSLVLRRPGELRPKDFSGVRLVIAREGAEIAGAPLALPILRMPAAEDDLPGPAKLRAAVRKALESPAGAGRDGDSWFERVYLGAARRTVIERARRTGMPLLIHGEAGSGRRRVAQLVHGDDLAGLIARHGTEIDPPARVPPEELRTLYIEDVDLLSRAGQRWLLGALADRGFACGRDAPRLVTSTAGDLQALAEGGSFSPGLYPRIAVLAVELPALRRRAAEIPELAAAIAGDLCARLSRPVVPLTDAARERLAHYYWFGHLAELEAVLARTLAGHEGPQIDADDLFFDPREILQDWQPRPPDVETLSRVAGDPAAISGNGFSRSRDLARIAHELAHTLKNPMVTVKTLTQTLERVDDPEERQRALDLTGQAVGRMNDVIENLLAFARFTEPQQQTVDPADLVARVVGELAPEAAERGVTIETSEEAAAPASADPEQAVFALRNALACLAAEMPKRSRLSVSTDGSRVVLTVHSPRAFRFRLAEWTENGEDTSRAVPVALDMAREVLRAGGGDLHLHLNERPPRIEIELAAAEPGQERGDDGTSARTDRR